MDKLNRDEYRVFKWLAKEDFGGLYGECHGPALDRLVELGLAEIGPDTTGKGVEYRRVGITDYGWEVMDEIRAAAAEGDDLDAMAAG